MNGKALHSFAKKENDDMRALGNKIVYLTANWRLERPIHSVDTAQPPICYPIEWGYLSNENHQAYVMDEYAANRPISETVESVLKIDPDVIILSTSPSYLYWRCPPFNIQVVIKYVSVLKDASPQSTIIIIGPHGTSDPRWIFDQCQADYVFRGEPDGNLNMGVSTDQLKDNPWLANRSDFKSIAPQRSFNEIGTCNYRGLTEQSYQPHAWGHSKQRNLEENCAGRYSMVELSRGCPFDCEYCFRAGFRNVFRNKPIHLFLKEVEDLVKYQVKYVFFIDETFGIDWDHTLTAMQLLADKQIRFGVQSRPDILTKKRLHTMSELGCDYIEFGLETNDKLCSDVLQKFKNYEAAVENINFAKQCISHVNVNILDLTNKDYIRNVPNVTQYDNEGFLAPPLLPYPGTVFGDRAISKYRDTYSYQSDWELAELVFLHYSRKAGLLKDSKTPETCSLKTEFHKTLQQDKNALVNKTNGTSRYEKLFSKTH